MGSKKKKKKYLKSNLRGIHDEPNGPGYFNPFRSDKFPDKKKKKNKRLGRQRPESDE